MKLVFIDCEFTGEHAFATLVSIGLVTLEGEELYINLNDFDRAQVTPWLTENVLSKIDEVSGIDSEKACRLFSTFFEKYSGGNPISLISAGKLNDILLLFQLWHTMFSSLPYFHFGNYLPDYLNHRAHFDLNTLFFAAGIDPNISREEYAGETDLSMKHVAIYDARIVRLCFMKLMRSGKLPHIAVKLPELFSDSYKAIHA
jgi:DNA polymerase III epsilon subunit-like protein